MPYTPRTAKLSNTHPHLAHILELARECRPQQFPIVTRPVSSLSPADLRTSVFTVTFSLRVACAWFRPPTRPGQGPALPPQLRQSLTMRYSLILPSLLLLACNVRAGCYFSDRTMDKNVEYQPCSEDPSNPLSTICCATNRKDGADICAPNGLCQVGTKKGSPPAAPAWTKPSCTNQDWSEDGCLHVCGVSQVAPV
jgi:hypothetical protein